MNKTILYSVYLLSVFIFYNSIPVLDITYKFIVFIAGLALATALPILIDFLDKK